MSSHLKPGPELARAFDDHLLSRYYEAARQGRRQNLSSGDPLGNPFGPARLAVQEAMVQSEMSLYSRGGGPKRFRDQVLPYCEGLGISPKAATLSHENITFGLGSTHLYNTVLKILKQRGEQTHPGKVPVILVPAPTYGVFTTQPVNHGYEIETFDLREEDGWQIDPVTLARRSRDINARKDKYVAALYFANPHNPTGAVAGDKQTRQVASVLQKHNIFAIDDMAYAGIEHQGKAVPISKYNFDNAVTLLTLSKAYCLPRARAGVACGPSWLINEIDHEINMTMISSPASVFAAAAACFSEKHRHEREMVYLPGNSEVYQSHYGIVKAMIDGMDSIGPINSNRKNKILQAVTDAYGSQPAAKTALAKGIPQLRLMNDRPQAGYFSMVQIKDLDHMFYGTTRLRTASQFAVAAVDIGKVLCLPLSFALAGARHGNALRMSFGGMMEKTIARAIKGLGDTLTTLPHKQDVAQQKHLTQSGKLLPAIFAR